MLSCTEAIYMYAVQIREGYTSQQYNYSSSYIQAGRTTVHVPKDIERQEIRISKVTHTCSNRYVHVTYM